MELKVATDKERAYTYRLPVSIDVYAGLIGYLRVDYGTDGKSFFNEFNDGPFKEWANENDFRSAFNLFVDNLRNFLGTLDEMSKFCVNAEWAAFKGNCYTEYAFRKDDDKFVYIMRFIPVKNDYNMYIYCYRKDRFNAYTEKKVRFITPEYRERFVIPNGGKIKVTYSDGKQAALVCYYIDDYHTVIGGCTYHICEWAERTRDAGVTYEEYKEVINDEA